MIRPDQRTIEALARIASSNEGEVFLEWLAQSTKESMDTLLSTHEIHAMHRGQGAIKELNNIKKAFAESLEFVRAHK